MHNARVELYLVRLMPGRAYAPGEFEEYTQFAFTNPPTAVTSCFMSLINPQVEQTAMDIVARSSSSSDEELTCSGLRRGMRMPLENELTTDGDAYESSWRHYLALAAAAAQRADMLGEEVIRNGLENDTRAEGAVDALETACGGAVNVHSVDGAGISRTAGLVGGECPTNYVRSGSVCVFDSVEYARTVAASDPAAGALEACLGDSNVLPFVSLGGGGVCFWMNDAGDRNTVCEYPSDSISRTTYPCPMPCTAVSDMTNVPAGYTAHITDASLGLFTPPNPEDPPQTTTADGVSANVCELLARVRLHPSYRADAVADLRSATDFMSRSGFAQYADSLQWGASAGSFSAVQADGTTVFSTGNAAFGMNAVSTTWPCAPRSPEDNGLCPVGTALGVNPLTHQGPLFCLDVNCNVEEDRAAVNEMLARAVLAAHVISGTNLAGRMQVPFSPRVYQYPTSQTVIAQNGSPGPDPFFLATHPDGRWENRAGTPRAWDVYDVPFNELRGDVQVVEGHEWLGRRYSGSSDLGSFDVASEGSECTTESNCIIGSFYRRFLPDLVDLPDGRGVSYASALWGDGSSEVPADYPYRGLIWNVLDGTNTTGLPAVDGLRPLGSRGQPLASLTNYWRRYAISGCDFAGNFCSEPSLTNLQNAQTCTTDTGSNCSNIGCRTVYGQCAAWTDPEGDNPNDFDYATTLDGNQAFIAPYGLEPRDILNALELTCAVARRVTSSGTTFGCTGNPPPITTMRQAGDAAQYIRCRTNGLRRNLATSMLRDVPQVVVQQLADSRTGSSRPGAISAQTQSVAAAITRLRGSQDAIILQADRVSTALSNLRTAIEQSRIRGRMADLELVREVSNQVTACVTGALDAAAASMSEQGAAGGGVRAASAAARCVNSAIQIVTATQLRDLQASGQELEVVQAITGFQSTYQEASAALSKSVGELQGAVQEIRAGLTSVETSRQGAQRQLARALFLDSDEAGRTYPVNTVMRRRLNTSAIRYQAARTQAVQAAELARRAVEQRLGIPLREMTEPLSLVEAPSTWVDGLCDVSGIDYNRVRMANPSLTGVPDNYAGEYIGDYVRKLELVVESYNFDYPFQDGGDTAVISLRDDLIQSRSWCVTESPNLVVNSGDLNQVSSEVSSEGWVLEGCLPSTAPGVTPAVVRGNCMRVESMAEATGTNLPTDRAYNPMSTSTRDFGRAGMSRIVFGGEPAGASPGVTSSTMLTQWLHPGPGRYVVSWYERTGNPVTVELVQAPSDEHGLYDELSSYTSGVLPFSNDWQRVYIDCVLPAGADLGFLISPNYGSTFEVRAADVGGFQVERVAELRGSTGTIQPGVYFDSGELNLPVCEDTRGDEFRRVAWTRNCMRECPDGFDGSCTDGALRRRCFWQTSVPVSSDMLDRLTGSSAGFAAGNHNYRFDTLGLNLVGTALRDCSGSSSGGCYGAGNFSYSILHTGPFTVRNARGGEYEAPLFPGRIESARALAAERYVTNPLSPSDQSLLQPYMRREFQGRPLGGNITLRLWDDGAFRFDRLEDVQLILNYRYWTHQR